MILSCNSCEKKFVVPDKAITISGRMVQCGSCGNKWKQFPIKNEANVPSLKNKIDIKKKPNLTKTSKTKKKKPKKIREINLYSPEYLEKKHGISIKNKEVDDNNKSNKNTTLGFYNSLLIFIVTVITLSKSLHFFQDLIVQKIPFMEFYLDYFFESIRNILEILKNLISKY
jgi:predicted Zn finger-like uncharacterized protein